MKSAKWKVQNEYEGTSDLLERLFRLRESGTTVRVELRAGVATFLTMSYIIFVQPAILSQAGMDFGAVMAATCISSAVAIFYYGHFCKLSYRSGPGDGSEFPPRSPVTSKAPQALRKGVGLDLRI